MTVHLALSLQSSDGSEESTLIALSQHRLDGKGQMCRLQGRDEIGAQIGEVLSLNELEPNYP